ncbi:hypothetical protein Hdeb2414_s0012g00378801 [Helianthus debilis subsp. tardiflorus]
MLKRCFFITCGYIITGVFYHFVLSTHFTQTHKHTFTEKYRWRENDVREKPMKGSGSQSPQPDEGDDGDDYDNQIGSDGG